MDLELIREIIVKLINKKEISVTEDAIIDAVQNLIKQGVINMAEGNIYPSLDFSKKVFEWMNFNKSYIEKCRNEEIAISSQLTNFNTVEFCLEAAGNFTEKMIRQGVECALRKFDVNDIEREMATEIGVSYLWENTAKVSVMLMTNILFEIEKGRDIEEIVNSVERGEIAALELLETLQTAKVLPIATESEYVGWVELIQKQIVRLNYRGHGYSEHVITLIKKWCESNFDWLMEELKLAITINPEDQIVIARPEQYKSIKLHIMDAILVMIFEIQDISSNAMNILNNLNDNYADMIIERLVRCKTAETLFGEEMK